MRWTPFVFALVLVAAPATTGCIGFGGDGGEDVNETSTEDEPPSDENRSADENESSDENGTSEGPTYGDTNESESQNETEDESETAWTYDNRTGTVSGANAVVTTTGSAEETFTVDPNTLELALNLSAEGGELEMCLTEPGGNESGGNESGEESSCDETVTTQDGNASFRAQDPAEGEWKATLRPADPGQHSIDYELVVAQLVQQEEGL